MQLGQSDSHIFASHTPDLSVSWPFRGLGGYLLSMHIDPDRAFFSFSSVHFFYISCYYCKGHTDDLFIECISVEIQSIKKWRALHRPQLNVINARPK